MFRSDFDLFDIVIIWLIVGCVIILLAYALFG